jgi:hypothetical protein
MRTDAGAIGPNPDTTLAGHTLAGMPPMGQRWRRRGQPSSGVDTAAVCYVTLGRLGFCVGWISSGAVRVMIGRVGVDGGNYGA